MLFLQVSKFDGLKINRLSAEVTGLKLRYISFALRLIPLYPMAGLESYFNPILYLMFMERLKYKSSILQLQSPNLRTGSRHETQNRKPNTGNPVSETQYRKPNTGNPVSWMARGNFVSINIFGTSNFFNIFF